MMKKILPYIDMTMLIVALLSIASSLCIVITMLYTKDHSLVFYAKVSIAFGLTSVAIGVSSRVIEYLIEDIKGRNISL